MDVNKEPAEVPAPSEGLQGERVQRLLEFFKNTYGKEPNFLTRAPGRVNLIGEHIDYCGYSVLPMAIEQDILVAVAVEPQGSQFQLENIDGSYESFTCPITVTEVNREDHGWHNYALCGFLGIKEKFSLEKPKGMLMAVDGSIPPSAGLSSSSALVCAIALATMKANELKLTKLELASLCAKSERYVGTEGGGMDQAISFLGESGTAKLIDFNPLVATDVALPDGYVFVIGNSCVEHNKAAASNYNYRVSECRLAAQLMAHKQALEWKLVKRLVNTQTLLNVPPVAMIDEMKKLLHPERYTRSEIIGLLECTDEELRQLSLNAMTADTQEFRLFQRALHVYSEAARVQEFYKVCSSGGPNIAEKLGQLMNASHASCRDLYECSHPQLDDLVNCMVTSGALGARLTGAGWGGCAVALVLKDNLKNFLQSVRTNFYAKHSIPDDQKNLFATKPGAGAAIYTL